MLVPECWKITVESSSALASNCLPSSISASLARSTPEIMTSFGSEKSDGAEMAVIEFV